MSFLLRILLILFASLPAAAQTLDAHTWQARLAQENDKRLTVTSAAGQINLLDARGAVDAIPASSIYEIFHTTHRVRRSTKVQNAVEHVCCPRGATHGGGHLLSAVVGALGAPAGTAKGHYVEIHWRVAGEGDNMVTLALAKHEYQPFMDWLQQITGVKWRDVEHERQKALKRVEERAGSAFPVRMPYAQADGGVTYHKYLALPIDDNDSTDLYFFEGSVKPQKVVGGIPVTRGWSINSCVFDVEVLYGKCHAEGCAIEAILLPTLTYRVDAVAFNKVSPVSDSSCLQLEKQKAEQAQRDW